MGYSKQSDNIAAVDLRFDYGGTGEILSARAHVQSILVNDDDPTDTVLKETDLDLWPAMTDKDRQLIATAFLDSLDGAKVLDKERRLAEQSEVANAQ